MRLSEQIKNLTSNGAAVLAEVFEAADISDWGLRRSIASAWQRTAALLHGPTRFTRQQRLWREAATSNRHSVDTLVMINSYAARLEDTASAWRFRVEMTRISGPYEQVAAAAKKRFHELVDTTPAPPEPSSRVRRGRQGVWQHVYTGDEEFVAKLDANIRARATDDTDAARAAAFEAIINGGGTAEVEVSTTAVVTLDEQDKILGQRGSETLIGLSDGTVVTGAQLITRKLAKDHYFQLVHPVHGSVNLYHAARGPNRKMRRMLKAENLVCPWPGCNQPADLSQVHHILAWQDGGPTNLSNLVICCKYHNRINDDDRFAPARRGRLLKEGWRSPYGVIKHNDHPCSSLGALSLARQRDRVDATPG